MNKKTPVSVNRKDTETGVFTHRRERIAVLSYKYLIIYIPNKSACVPVRYNKSSLPST